MRMEARHPAAWLAVRVGGAAYHKGSSGDLDREWQGSKRGFGPRMAGKDECGRRRVVGLVG
jgi:hypothetical protein